MYKRFHKIGICVFIIILEVLYLYLLHRKEKFTGKNQEVEIVVARYNEDLHWLNDDIFKPYNITIYNKGIDYTFPKNEQIKRIVNVDNVGRCDHTYLYHIIHNYDQLANVTVFLPGSCNMPSKYPNVIEIMNRLAVENNTIFLYHSEDVYEQYKDFYLDDWKASDQRNNTLNSEVSLTPSKYRPFGVWYKHHFGDIHVNHFAVYGIFAVHKHHILQHPKSYYENLIQELEVSSNPEVGHYFERGWAAVFYPIE